MKTRTGKGLGIWYETARFAELARTENCYRLNQRASEQNELMSLMLLFDYVFGSDWERSFLPFPAVCFCARGR